MGEALFAKIQSEGKISEVVQILFQNLWDGEIVVASPRPDIQPAIESLGLFDTWVKSPGDFLYPIFTSVGRNKSDRVMRRVFEVEQINACDRKMTMTQYHLWDADREQAVLDIMRALGLDKSPVPLLFLQ
jgi:hypothetical protein